jgi:hypothetical protein
LKSELKLSRILSKKEWNWWAQRGYQKIHETNRNCS